MTSESTLKSAMANDRVVDDDESRIVTEFLLDTCRLLQPSKFHVWAAYMCCALMVRRQTSFPTPDNSGEIYYIPLRTGSSAEFYIQPMLSDVGDIDIMFHSNNQLAIPEGHLPPTHLPAEFYSRVFVYEVVESEYAGYVYLAMRYLLTEVSSTGKYSALKYDRRHYQTVSPHHTTMFSAFTTKFNGPAFTMPGMNDLLSRDEVLCIRYLSWPLQARDWPLRHRNYGWPDSATVDLVVSNGCDVVRVAHRQCRQHKILGNYQWRLSFSRAEIVLLNSWMPVQQIVYHMLRVFAKAARLADITDSSGSKIICNYHFKTLMMWACELKPRSWWIDDLNVVKICVRLLHILADWLNSEIYPHYFVQNCSLLGSVSDLHKVITDRLTPITDSWLSRWFVNNYLRKCAQLCPDRVSRLFDDVGTTGKLQNAVSAVIKWRTDSAVDDLWKACVVAQYLTLEIIRIRAFTARSCGYWFNELAKISSCLHSYTIAVAFIDAAKRIARHSLNNELLDTLATAVGQFVGKRLWSSQLSSELSLTQAVKLMKVVMNKSHSTVQLIEVELSKAYLHRALRCKDSHSDSIYSLANVYLAVLYDTTGQYQTAIDHCALVTRSQDHSQCSSRVVQGDVLPTVVDDIDVLGLTVLYQYVLSAELNRQQTQYLTVFTTELFAHHLHVRCLSVINCHLLTQLSSRNEVRERAKYVLDSDQLFIADVLLLKSIKMSSSCNYSYYRPSSKLNQKSTTVAHDMNTSELVELLQQSAVEHTTFRQLQAQEFRSVATIVTTEYEALYAYKRGDYQRCLQLSIDSWRTLLHAANMTSVSTLPAFAQLFTDDVVSVTALTQLVNPRCTVNRCYNSITQMTLSLNLMTLCRLKLRHSLKSLAKTLEYIEFAHRRLPGDRTLDHLTLMLTERKLIIYVSGIMQQ